MVVIALIAAVVSGASFEVIKHWPLPVSVAPVFGFKMGGLWGLVVGAVSGLVLGFCTDDATLPTPRPIRHKPGNQAIYRLNLDRLLKLSLCKQGEFFLSRILKLVCRTATLSVSRCSQLR